MRSKSIILIMAFIIVLSWRSSVFSLDEKTHRAINEHIAQYVINGFSLKDYLINNLGFNKGEIEVLRGTLSGTDDDGNIQKKSIFWWLSYGGEQEDRPGSSWDYVAYNPTRSVNHFHNPLKPWNEAGLYDYLAGLRTGQSSILWAQSPATSLGGDWSWQDARRYFYTALRDPNPELKEEYFARTFRALGQQMHLVQDASVPEHVRNSAHAAKAYEGFVKDFMDSKVYGSLWADLISHPITFDKSILAIATNNDSAPVPIARIIDADFYDGTNPDVTMTILGAPQRIGLAEYTQANFLSKKTLFANDQNDPLHYFPYPKAADVVVWQDKDNYNRSYYSKVGSGDPVKHLAYSGFIDEKKRIYFPQDNEWRPVALDRACYKEYARNLIPRAVGYSAGLLNYFFRGNIEISLPDDGIYAITGPGGKFTKIKLKAKNTTANGEKMTNGTLQLVVKYKTALTDPFQVYDGCIEETPDYSYIVAPEASIVAPEASGKTSLSMGEEATPLTFNLDPGIPLEATDVYLQVVYKGQLGNEADAVAVGFKDISEPTPLDIRNDTDYICIGGTNYRAGSAEAIKAANDIGYPNPDVSSLNITYDYLAFTLPDAPKPASSENYHAYFAGIPPGYYGRVYILTDYKGFYYSDKSNLQNPVFYSDTGSRTQDEIIGGVDYCFSPTFDMERDVATRTNVHYYKFLGPTYNCPIVEAPINDKTPVPVTIHQ